MRQGEFKKFITEGQPVEEQPSAKKKGKLRGCLFLFTLQIILLTVWGALFFLLGIMVQFNQLPDWAQGILSELAKIVLN